MARLHRSFDEAMKAKDSFMQEHGPQEPVPIFTYENVKYVVCGFCVIGCLCVIYMIAYFGFFVEGGWSYLWQTVVDAFTF